MDSPTELIRDNAGRLLGEMLGMNIEGVERKDDCIGPYRLCELLGSGGFGNVWRAEQTEPVRREVAVKVIKLGMDTVQVLGRFNQERQALASLDHPSIATMLDAGVSPNGRPYFAMEFVRGGSITDWCEQHKATLPERLRLFIQVCLAVQHAHEKGILHRDLKPTNILVTEVGGEPVPKIIDFGIAKAIHASTLDDLSRLTQEDQVIGTPIYMSPEQIEGGRAPDPRSDVYALGVLLYELLTGVLPFDVTQVGGMAAVKHLILENVPVRPSTIIRLKTAAQKKLKAGFQARLSALPADLDWITMRALEKDRLRRYQTAADFAADVQRHLDNEPVVARPPSVGYKAGRWLRRHRRGVITACLGAVAATALTVAERHLQNEARKPKAIKLAPGELYTNSLGMKFTPVPGTDVLFCIHETRNKDFTAYAAEVPGAIGMWKTGVQRGFDPVVENWAEHPAIHVDWDEAMAFCTWLSKKEGRTYRLPTDREWSIAVGIGGQENWAAGSTPSAVAQVKDQYPWEGPWPAPPGAGNYKNLPLDDAAAIKKGYLHGYIDGFATTAPVMSFTPNHLGLYDMGGNVFEWVEDWWDDNRRYRILRGGSFTTQKPEELISSHRHLRETAQPIKANHYGCRFVLEVAPPSTEEPSVAEQVDTPPTPLAPAKFPDPLPEAEVKARSVTNSLGMKFIPVPGSDVLFCLHETRRQDYAAFASLDTGINGDWKSQQLEGHLAGAEAAHPVVGVSWDDAQDFCTWLSRKEGRLYRLPTDREWSIAVGLGPAEGAVKDSTPEKLGNMGRTEFPYGTGLPSTTRVGNYADTTHHQAFPGSMFMGRYDDGYVTTAPVMSCQPNPFGLYDLGGNVWEWCVDLTHPRAPDRIIRGGSWQVSSGEDAFSAKRGSRPASRRDSDCGFRCILVPATAIPKQ